MVGEIVLVIYLRAVRQDIPWVERNMNTDQWIKKTGVIQFHLSGGKIYLFYASGNHTWFKLSEVARMAIEDDNLTKEKKDEIEAKISKE